MKIPKIIQKEQHIYEYVKTYPNYIMYKDINTGFNECFQVFDIIAQKNKHKDNTPKWEK